MSVTTDLNTRTRGKSLPERTGREKVETRNTDKSNALAIKGKKEQWVGAKGFGEGKTEGEVRSKLLYKVQKQEQEV